MAPLQRAAERLAEKAVPMAAASRGPHVSLAASDHVDVYRRAVRLAMRDRRLSREEELHLLDLAHRLGISPTVAAQIHDEVERASGGARDATRPAGADGLDREPSGGR